MRWGLFWHLAGQLCASLRIAVHQGFIQARRNILLELGWRGGSKLCFGLSFFACSVASLSDQLFQPLGHILPRGFRLGWLLFLVVQQARNHQSGAGQFEGIRFVQEFGCFPDFRFPLKALTIGTHRLCNRLPRLLCHYFPEPLGHILRRERLIRRRLDDRLIRRQLQYRLFRGDTHISQPVRQLFVRAPRRQIIFITRTLSN